MGSIGTVLVVEDFSKQAEDLGIKVHVIATGPNKGAGIPGSEVTDEQLKMFAERVEGMNAHFLAAVRGGRKLSRAQLEAVTDGRVFIAEKAKGLGLIDAVQSDDATMGEARALAVERGERQRRERRAAAGVKLAAARAGAGK